VSSGITTYCMTVITMTTEISASFEPVVQAHLGAFAEVGAEPALAAKASQLPGARPGDHKPVAADNIVPHRTDVLEQECAAPPAEFAGDPLDACKAG